LASSARPELSVAAVGMLLAAISRGRRRHPAWLAIGLLVLALMALGFARSSGRSFLAVQIAFGSNWLGWHHGWRDIFSIWEGEFGAAQSLLDAIIANPPPTAHA